MGLTPLYTYMVWWHIRRTPPVPHAMPARGSHGPRTGISNVFHILWVHTGAPARVPYAPLRTRKGIDTTRICNNPSRASYVTVRPRTVCSLAVYNPREWAYDFCSKQPGNNPYGAWCHVSNELPWKLTPPSICTNQLYYKVTPRVILWYNARTLGVLISRCKMTPTQRAIRSHWYWMHAFAKPLSWQEGETFHDITNFSCWVHLIDMECTHFLSQFWSERIIQHQFYEIPLIVLFTCYTTSLFRPLNGVLS